MRTVMMASIIALAAAGAGCAAAVGAGAAGAGYEYENKQALNQVEQDYKSGKISRGEYLRRRDAIEKKSLIY